MSVDIGVACSGSQAPAWWTQVFGNLMAEVHDMGLELGKIHAISSALPDHNKNHTLEVLPPQGMYEKRRAQLTDSNRQVISKSFLDGKADWLFQIDDDTIPPFGAITSLLQKRREFIAGIYFLPRAPFTPIAYMRNGDTGLYAPVVDWPEGSLMQVDSVGMGCTLIHRSVFEKILVEHECYARPNGSLVAVHKKQIKGTRPRQPLQKGASRGASTAVRLVDGVLQIPLQRLAEGDNRVFPFYALEYGRTEDHHFCELAAAVGVKPWLDTSVRCEHLKIQGTTYEQYKRGER